jgi:hypothetical protein
LSLFLLSMEKKKKRVCVSPFIIRRTKCTHTHIYIYIRKMGCERRRLTK